ncbi:MAG: LTA synthase family protein [Gemmatimonadota bacterium]
MRTRLRISIAIFLFWLVYFWLARAMFLAFHAAETRSLSLGEVFGTFLHGFRLDASGSAYLTAVPVVLLMLSTIRPFTRFARSPIKVWLYAVLVPASFLIATDLETFTRLDRRIDGALLVYLKTPREALASAGASPVLLLIAVALALIAFGWWAIRRVIDRYLARLEPVNPIAMIPLFGVLALLVIPARGGIQLIPVNTASAYFSGRPFANAAAGNALWGFADSIYRGLYDRSNPFRVMPDSTASEVVSRARPSAPPAPNGLLRTSRPNILLVVWESGSARAVERLGGVAGVTPGLDSLSRDGILFDRFYAAGDRTDKGIAAILSGFPGIPRSSILMVPDKTRGLPSLSRDLEGAGYRTAFYYGGELEFAGLRAYLVNQRFDTLVGRADFPRAGWTSKWGVHDGPVADRLLLDLARAQSPFFAVWLTLSSHEPFDVPMTHRFPGSDWQSQYLSSMAYTDQVIADLVRRARGTSWWENTLVIIVADHGRRVLPLDSAAYHRSPDGSSRIPMLWLGGALAVRDSVAHDVGSQLDIAPTVLGLLRLGGADRYRWSHSLLGPDRRRYAYWGFDEGFGLVRDESQLVFDHRAGRLVFTAGHPDTAAVTLGKALLQLTYQEYLDR